MLDSILTAVVDLVVFSIWLYGAAEWRKLSETDDQKWAFVALHSLVVGFFIDFVVGVYLLSRLAFRFAENFIARSLRRSEIDVNHFLETIGKDAVEIIDDKIIFGERAVVDTKSLVMIIRQKSDETKTFNISKSDLRKILPIANKGVKMNFYDAIASSLETEGK